MLWSFNLLFSGISLLREFKDLLLLRIHDIIVKEMKIGCREDLREVEFMGLCKL